MTLFNKYQSPPTTQKHKLSVYVFGCMLASYRLRIGMTQVRVSRRSGISVRTIQRIEKGDGWIRVSTARRLARAVKINIDQLMCRPYVPIVDPNHPSYGKTTILDHTKPEPKSTGPVVPTLTKYW